MTTIFSEDLDKICRCCLCKNGEMRPLFGSCIDNMLRFVADIDVHAGDGLPELMCVPCVLQVSRAFTFKQQCQRSNQTLKSYVGQLNKHNEADNNNIQNVYRNEELENVEQRVIDEHVIDENVVTNNIEDSTFMSTDNTTTDDLDSELVLDSLPPEIESGSFEEEIELSNLASTKCENIEHDLDTEVLIESHDDNQSKVNKETMKFGDYFDEIKLNIAHAVSLTNSEIQDQSIEETFDDISTVANDVVINKNASDFIENILSSENIKNERNDGDLNLDCSSNISFETEDKLDSNVNDPTDSFSNNDVNKIVKKNAYECAECHKVFGENKILKRHLKIHSPIKPHACPECDMSFAESSNLSKHMKKHTGELRNVVGKPNLCSVCGKGFKWASSLSKHMKHHTKHKILNCPYCPKYYVEARSLNIHLRSHTGEKPFICEVCKKGFTQMGNLEKHIRVHTGERPFSCPICHKGFSQSGYVAIHLRTHTGEKPYRCDVENCGRAFAGSNTLAIHKRTHTGERPYSCSVCDKTFARQETANIHQRTHTGEKPFKCSICSRGFTSSGHLTGHMRSHNGTKTHECKICQKRFAGSSSLKVHMKCHSEKIAQQQQQQQEQEIFDAKTTIFECNMCKMNIPSSALTSPDELQAYNHEFMDDVLICSNVASIIDNGKIIEEIHDENGTNIILATATDIENGQQLLINLSDLK